MSETIQNALLRDEITMKLLPWSFIPAALQRPEIYPFKLLAIVVEVGA